MLFGESSGAAMSALIAATYPRRTRALVLSNTRARTSWTADYPWGMQQEEYARELEFLRRGWDSGEYVRSPVAGERNADEMAYLAQRIPGARTRAVPLATGDGFGKSLQTE